LECGGLAPLYSRYQSADKSAHSKAALGAAVIAVRIMAGGIAFHQ